MVRQAAENIDGVDPITLDRTQEVVNLYRSVYCNVVNLWHYCQDVVIPDIANGCSLINVDHNGWFITQKDGFGRPVNRCRVPRLEVYRWRMELPEGQNGCASMDPRW